MKQSKALYCLTVGYITGASLNKTTNYEIVNNGYSFRVLFTPITFVKISDLNQPIHYNGQTYLFGFSPKELHRIAAITKKDLEDGLLAEQNWVNLTKRKLQSTWEKLAAEVARESQAVEQSGGVPTVPPASPSNFTIPATPPTMIEDTQPTETAPITSVMAGESAPAAVLPPQATGSVERSVNTFHLYIASAKAKHDNSPAIGYAAVIQNIGTGEQIEIGKGGRTDDFNKMLVRALQEAFASGIVPPSTQAEQTLVMLYTSNEFIANMFAKHYLRNFARNQWKKKDGGILPYKEEWESIWSHTSHMIVRAVLCEPDGADLKFCTDKADAFAEGYHQKLCSRNTDNSR